MQVSETTRKLFAQECKFVAGAATAEQIPDLDLPEVAFIGRSNVGKSSILNALTNRKALARVSHTPGRTQQINFFNLGNKVMLVDLPGYGYAKVEKAKSYAWNELILGYLRERPNLKRIFLLIDSRHGLKDGDKLMMELIDQFAVVYQIVLTKVDKRKKSDNPDLKINFKKHPALSPDLIETSSHDKIGINLLQEVIASLT